MEKIELQELANKLFMYTDAQDWQGLQSEVFTEEVWFDMRSAGGGEPRSLAARDICAMWQEGFKGLDSVHHQAGHYLVEVNGDGATIFGYAMAVHYKGAAARGKTRTFVGSYNLKAVRQPQGWRLSSFTYNLKFIDGNAALL
jgi:hypothetical protein